MAATITYEQKRRSDELLQMYLRFIGKNEMTNKRFSNMTGIPRQAINGWTERTKPLPPKWHPLMSMHLVTET